MVVEDPAQAGIVVPHRRGAVARGTNGEPVEMPALSLSK